MTTEPNQQDPSQESSHTSRHRPWWQHPGVKALLWVSCGVAVLWLITTAMTALTIVSTTNDITDSFEVLMQRELLDSLVQMEALKAAGVFGDGAHGQLVRGVTAVTNALRDNLLGFVGASIILVVIGLAVSLSVGDPRAQERIAKLVQGVLMLAAAAGLVA